MIAIVGLPGSVHHDWRHFRTKRDCVTWIDNRRAEILEQNPALGTLPYEIVSDKVAAKRRYRDGTYVYDSFAEHDTVSDTITEEQDAHLDELVREHTK